tara:strand:+ start:1205 stop:2620 length:1416 start_codon:yes stop_codon:yes gene_type:complete
MHIYKITNLINKKIYIGLSTSSSNDRWKSHLWSAKNKAIQAIDRAIYKYGKENFKNEVLEKVSFKKGIKYLENREIYYISKYKSFKSNIGYNQSLGGNVNVAKKLSVKSKANMSKAQPKSLFVAAYKVNGKLYKTYNNLKLAADEFKISKSAIHKVLNRSDRICKNLIWRVSKNKNIPKKIEKFKHIPIRSRKIVYKWSKTGNLLEKYNSIADAATKNNCNTPDINRVLKKEIMFTGGFHWTYKNKFIKPRKRKFWISGSKVSLKVNVYNDKGKFIETIDGIGKTARKYGCDPSDISKCTLGKKRAHRFRNGKTYQFKRYNGSIKNINRLAKPLHGKKEILMYSLKGHFIKQFNSVTEASKKINVPRKTIGHCLTGSTLRAKNYLWRYKSGKIEKKILPYKSKHVKVLKYDFDGNFIKEFKTIKKAAESVKTNTANIQRCIDKKGYSSHQYYWFRKKSEKIKKKIKVPIFI